MTITDAEAAALLRDFERFAARYGGVVDRDLFDTTIRFARARDPDAMQPLARIYRFVTSELLREKRENGNGNKSQSVKV